MMSLRNWLILSLIILVLFFGYKIIPNWRDYYFEPIVLEQPYCYVDVGECIQRVPVFRDSSDLIQYSELYKNGLELKDGVFISKMRDRFFFPDSVVSVTAIDTLSNGVIFCKGYQKERNSHYLIEGYFFKVYCNKVQPDTNYRLCNQYIDATWSNIFRELPEETRW